MARLFTPKRDIDPNDWVTHVRRNLVHEVRAETIRFYGPTDCLEAKYPGLDYNKPAHRLRLNYFPYHRQLFKVFDRLQLTNTEVQQLCRWEGTRYAREIYETSNKIRIRDTTWDGVLNYCINPTTASQVLLRGGYIEAEALDDVEGQDEDQEIVESEMQDEVSEEESEDEMQESVGVELNQRLLAASEARARGEDVVIDADWEQWLKEAAERGIRPDMQQPVEPGSSTQETVYWGREIPEYLSDNPTPEMAAIQASLPPPPQYFPRDPSETATAPTLLLAPRTGTAL